MKRLLTGIVFLMLLNSGKAQTWEEWTQQKKTQRKYLVQQIAALQVYLGYAREGYSMTQKGLTTIHEIKKGDVELHEGFFTSSKKVNPAIASSAKVAAIVLKQLQVIKEAKQTVEGVSQSNAFTSEEVGHCKAVFQNLLLSCVAVIDELIELTTPGEFGMKDDERIKRIEVLYENMQNKYAFTAAYSAEMSLLSMQRMNEKVEINYSKKLREGL